MTKIERVLFNSGHIKIYPENGREGSFDCPECLTKWVTNDGHNWLTVDGTKKFPGTYLVVKLNPEHYYLSYYNSDLGIIPMMQDLIKRIPKSIKGMFFASSELLEIGKMDVEYGRLRTELENLTNGEVTDTNIDEVLFFDGSDAICPVCYGGFLEVFEDERTI